MKFCGFSSLSATFLSILQVRNSFLLSTFLENSPPFFLNVENWFTSCDFDLVLVFGFRETCILFLLVWDNGPDGELCNIFLSSHFVPLWVVSSSRVFISIEVFRFPTFLMDFLGLENFQVHVTFYFLFIFFKLLLFTIGWHTNVEIYF